jgi:DNA polymerase
LYLLRRPVYFLEISRIEADMGDYKNYAEFNRAKGGCRACPVGKAHNCVVASEGCTESPLVMIVGEAPGADEVKRRRPFIGKSGQILRRAIRPCGYTKHNTLISNSIPCRPEGNKYPDDPQLVHECMSRWLLNEIDLLKPEYMLLLGSKALFALFGLDGITSRRGTWLLLERGSLKIECLPTYHPSYVMRVRNMRGGMEKVADFVADIREVAACAGFLPDLVPGETYCRTSGNA